MEPTASAPKPRPQALGRLNDVPWWWAVLLPAVIYPALMLCAAVPGLRFIYQAMTRKESGIEFLGVGILLLGVVVGVVLVIQSRSRLPRSMGWLTWWFGLITLGMFVLAGEEISWGQHLGLWSHEQADAVMRGMNDQQETNLHNLSNALDQLPTYAVMIATLVGCVLNPIYLKVRGEVLEPDNPGYWFWPTPACLVCGLGVLLITWPKRIREWIGGEIPESVEVLWRHSEIHEFYIALLMTTYILSVFLRLRAMPEASRGE